jgi:hypothetical protein
MKYIILAALVLGIASIGALSIYQIQFTDNPGRDNTFPSLYAGKTVTVEGIVTATGYNHSGFYLSEPSGGAWRGIFVEAAQSSVKPGDKVVLRGTVSELYGMTCVKDVNSLSIIDSGRPMPIPSPVTTGQITSADQAEAYEGILVKVQNSTCIQNSLAGGRYSVNDGSGICIIDDAFLSGKVSLPRQGESFSSLLGVVAYAYGAYSINPRSRNDVVLMAPVFNQNRSWGRIKSIYK